MPVVATPRLVLFDLDGTLIDSLPELYEGVRRLLLSLNRAPLDQKTIGTMIGKGIGVLVERLYQRADLVETGLSQKEILNRLLEYWSKTDGRYIVFYPGALDGIRALRSNGIRTALVTNKIRSLTLSFLRERDIETLFDVVVAGDDTNQPKPAPDMLLRATQLMGMMPSESVMVGDSMNDALAAKAAGIEAFLVRTGYNEGIPIDLWATEHGFDNVYESVRDVCDVFVKGTCDALV